MAEEKKKVVLSDIKCSDIPSYFGTQFKDVYSKLHAKNNNETEAFYNTQAMFFKTEFKNTPEFEGCTKESVFAAWMEIAIQGITIQPMARRLAYLEKRAKKIADKYVDVMYLKISVYGEYELRIRAGQLKRYSLPTVVYEKDLYKVSIDDSTGKKKITYEQEIPRTSNKLKACFFRIEYHDNSFDMIEKQIGDMERLMAASKKQNKGPANNLYTSNDGQMDVGFFETKTMKAALKSLANLELRVVESESAAVLESEDDIENDIQEEKNEKLADEIKNNENVIIPANPQTENDLPF
jgi:hypothetical protein